MSSDPGGSRLEPVSQDLFRRACGHFATGVAIAGVADAQGRPHAITINSFTSVSLEPPLVLICLGHQSAPIQVFRDASYFGISILGIAQQDISERFAWFADDRFEATSWFPGPKGSPLIEGAIATLECKLVRWFPAGDHDVFLGTVTAANVTGGAPLLYFASDYSRLPPLD